LTPETARHFQSGLRYLDDIQRLSEENLSPLIRQAMTMFMRAQESMNADELTLSEFQQVERFSQAFVERHRQRILERLTIEDVSINFQTKKLKMASFDIILEALPLFSEVIRLLPFAGQAELSIVNDGMKFDGRLLFTDELENKRVALYALTRKLLSKGILLTFRHGPLTNGQADLTLDVRFPDQTGRLYLLDLENHKLPLVGFSAQLNHYEIHAHDLARLGRHLMIEVTKELNVEKFYRPSRRLLHADSGLEILHFAFLFRPVSLIIPKRCSLVHKSDLEQTLRGTGCDAGAARQDVEKGQRGYFFIDILSLMSA
jgi:hypothetical protein